MAPKVMNGFEQSAQQAKTPLMSKRILQATQDLFARVVAGAAHDLRSPLSTMTLNVSVLRKRWKELSQKEIEDLLDEIQSCGERQQRSIDAIIKSASISGVVEMELAAALRRVSEILHPMFRSRKNF